MKYQKAAVVISERLMSMAPLEFTYIWSIATARDTPGYVTFQLWFKGQYILSLQASTAPEKTHAVNVLGRFKGAAFMWTARYDSMKTAASETEHHALRR